MLTPFTIPFIVAREDLDRLTNILGYRSYRETQLHKENNKYVGKENPIVTKETIPKGRVSSRLQRKPYQK
jgi:hypothetical protein